VYIALFSVKHYICFSIGAELQELQETYFRSTSDPVILYIYTFFYLVLNRQVVSRCQF